MRRVVPGAASLLTVAVLLLSGCSPSTSAQTGVPELWRVQIDQLLESDSAEVADVHREILADHVITPAEYSELQQRLSDCLSSHGIEHELDPQDGGTLQTVDLPGDDDGSQTLDLATACIDSTTGPVEGIYLGMRENPEGLGKGEALRRCLDKAEASEFAGVPAAELERQITAADLNPTTPEAKLCEIDPFGAQGLGLDAARRMLADGQVEAGGQ